ncbi:MAG: hypothetical protein WBG43_09515 [Marinifilaceae bacterium]
MSKNICIIILAFCILSCADQPIVIKEIRKSVESLDKKEIMQCLFSEYNETDEISYVCDSVSMAGTNGTVDFPTLFKLKEKCFNEDSTICVIITENSTYKKHDLSASINSLHSKDTVSYKYDLERISKIEDGANIGYHEFVKDGYEWVLRKSMILDNKLGKNGRLPENIRLMEIGKDRFGIITEDVFLGRGEVIKHYSLYALIDDKLKEVSTEQMYYTNEGSVGKPEKLLNEKELKALSEKERNKYLRSTNYLLIESEYEVVKSSKEYYDIKVITWEFDYIGLLRSYDKVYICRDGEYV